MEQFEVRLFQRGPIITAHVIDEEGTLDVGVGESNEIALSQAITKMYARKSANNPALKLLEELVETADVDKVYDKAEKLIRKLV